MATERVTEHSDGSRTVERSERTGGGVLGVIVGVAILALVAIVAFFLLTSNRNDNLRTSAVTGAASSVSHAANNVGNAANSAASSATPKQ